MYSGLSLDQAPPYEAPLRYFLSAPLFGAVSGVLLIILDGDALFTRHTAESIVLIHTLVLGVITMTMLGALQQMLPVLAGVSYPAALWIARGVHVCFLIGILLFMGGYYFWIQDMLLGASGMLGVALLGFALLTLVLLFRVKKSNATIWAMRSANGMFIIAVLLGVHMLASHAGGTLSSQHILFLQFHMVAAGIGWVMILTLGVAFQVIPMFWVTTPFSAFCQRFVLPLAVGTIILYGIDLILLQMLPGWIFALLFFIVLAAFSATVVKKLKQRKRKVDDIAVNYWLFGMGFLMASALILLWQALFPGEYGTLFFVFFGYGFGISVIIGMLYKIIPFLAWFHLSSKGIWDVPTMREMIPRGWIQWQWRSHVGGIILLVLALWIPDVRYGAGVFLFVSFMILFGNLFRAASIYFTMGKAHAGTSN